MLTPTFWPSIRRHRIDYDPALDAHLSRIRECPDCGKPVVVVGLEYRSWRFGDVVEDVDRPVHECRRAEPVDTVPLSVYATGIDAHTG